MENIHIAMMWLIVSLFIAYAANQRGRSAIFWFIVCLLITPIIPAIMLMLLPVKEGSKAMADRKACPQCAESVKQEAKVCKHCGYRISVY